jgi:hypothetical protein
LAAVSPPMPYMSALQQHAAMAAASAGVTSGQAARRWAAKVGKGA